MALRAHCRARSAVRRRRQYIIFARLLPAFAGTQKGCLCILLYHGMSLRNICGIAVVLVLFRPSGSSVGCGPGCRTRCVITHTPTAHKRLLLSACGTRDSVGTEDCGSSLFVYGCLQRSALCTAYLGTQSACWARHLAGPANSAVYCSVYTAIANACRFVD